MDLKLKGKKLCKAIVIERHIMDNIERYRIETNPDMKNEITFVIQPHLWFIMPHNKYKVIQVSDSFYNSFLKDPSITLSYNHIEKRKDVAHRLFESYDFYNWKGDGRTIEKIVNDFQFNILTRTENSAGYKGETTLQPISLEWVEKIIKYQMYYKKGWFKTRPLRNYDEVKRIPLGKKFRKEIDLMSYMKLD